MTLQSPKITDAPGLTWNARKHGRWEARWQADSKIVQRHKYTPKSCRVWCGTEAELDDITRAFIQDRCRIMQNDMRVFAMGGLPIEGEFDGTLRSLINCYQTAKFSRYQKIRHQTRQNYDMLCARLVKERGLERIENIDSTMIMEWHEGWETKGVSIAHSMIGMLRTLFSFGSTLLKNPEGKAACKSIAAELHELRFAMPKARSEALTADQAIAIRSMAHAKGLPEVALAQAFQFDCTFRQKDVIGEWVPLSEPVPSDLIDGNDKWIRGIRWNEIDANLILRHTTSKRLKDVEIDLKLAGMVMEELTLAYGENFTRNDLPGSGAIIIAAGTHVPFKHGMFRRRWRQLADAAGIPKTVRSMDSRAGAITEALRSGASLDAVRKGATHSNSNMTQRYSRGDAEDIADVMKKRAALRGKNRA
jgi:hypothetical protein